MHSAKTGLQKTCRSVETSKPKQPGDEPDFIVYNALPNSSTVKSYPNICSSTIDSVKSIQKSSGRGYGYLQKSPWKNF
jgi:hypothetical protein